MLTIFVFIILVIVLNNYLCLCFIPISILSKQRYNHINKQNHLKCTEIVIDDIEGINEEDQAIREEKLMKLSERIPFIQINNVSPKGLVDELDLNGVIRIDNVLNIETTKILLSLINEQLSSSIASIDTLYSRNNEFSNSKAQDQRWDLKLHLTDTIHEIMILLLHPGSLLGDTLYKLVGNDAYITELAAFVTINGANRQIIHSDTFWSKLPCLYTCTIALQNISELMGPTVFIPATHTEKAFLQRVQEYMEDDIDQDSRLLYQPHTLSMLNEGSAAIYDSRLLHCGGANQSKDPRVLFYFTISNPLASENINDDDILFEDPDGIFSDVKEMNITSSIRSENIGYKLSDFRKI